MKKTGLKVIVFFFSFDFNPIDTNDILDTYKYLMKGTMFGLIKKIFIGLLTDIVSRSNLTIYIRMNTVKNFTPIHLRFN